MIKPIEQKDLTECAKVIRESFSTVADEFGFTVENAPRFTAFATTTERLAWHLTGERRPMFAYFDDKKIVGYYSLFLQENDECELNNLCVLPSYRHRKIGETLLKHSFQMSKEFGCNKMKIGIVEENQVLRKWYESFEFVHIGTKNSISFRLPVDIWKGSFYEKKTAPDRFDRSTDGWDFDGRFLRDPLVWR